MLRIEKAERNSQRDMPRRIEAARAQWLGGLQRQRLAQERALTGQAGQVLAQFKPRAGRLEGASIIAGTPAPPRPSGLQWQRRVSGSCSQPRRRSPGQPGVDADAALAGGGAAIAPPDGTTHRLPAASAAPVLQYSDSGCPAGDSDL